MRTSPDGGVLNIDQAASLLINEPDLEQPSAEAAGATVEDEPDEAPEDAPEPADEPEEAPEEAAEEEVEPEDEEPEPVEEEAPEPVVDPPYYWPADAKEQFGKLPAELQELVAEQEKGRDTAIRSAQQQLAEARKAATTEAQKLIEQMPAIETALAEVKAAYAAEDWDTVKWAEWADADPVKAFQAKLVFDAQTRQMQQLETARQKAEDEQFKAYTVEQAEELQKLAPAIAADNAVRSDIVKYLIDDNGYDADLIRGIRAKDVVIAHKAMLWDRAQSKAKAQIAPGAVRPAQTASPRKATPSAPVARPVRPATAATAPSPKRAVVERETSFKAKPSTENAIALLLARGTG